MKDVSFDTLQSKPDLFRRALIEAHRNGEDVRVLDALGDGRHVTRPPRDWAASYGWESALEDVEQEVATRRRQAEQDVIVRAMRAQQNPTKSRRLVSCGRDADSGKVVALYQAGDHYEYEAVQEDGSVSKGRV